MLYNRFVSSNHLSWVFVCKSYCLTCGWAWMHVWMCLCACEDGVWLCLCTCEDGVWMCFCACEDGVWLCLCACEDGVWLCLCTCEDGVWMCLCTCEDGVWLCLCTCEDGVWLCLCACGDGVWMCLWISDDDQRQVGTYIGSYIHRILFVSHSFIVTIVACYLKYLWRLEHTMEIELSTGHSG